MEKIFKNKKYKLTNNHQVMIWGNTLTFVQGFKDPETQLKSINIIDSNQHPGPWEYMAKSTTKPTYQEKCKGMRSYTIYIFKNNNVLYELSKYHAMHFFQNFEEIV